MINFTKLKTVSKQRREETALEWRKIKMKRKYVTAFLMTLILIVAPVSDPFVTRVSAAENHISAAADVVDLYESDWDTVS